MKCPSSGASLLASLKAQSQIGRSSDAVACAAGQQTAEHTDFITMQDSPTKISRHAKVAMLHIASFSSNDWKMLKAYLQLLPSLINENVDHLWHGSQR